MKRGWLVNRIKDKEVFDENYKGIFDYMAGADYIDSSIYNNFKNIIEGREVPKYSISGDSLFTALCINGDEPEETIMTLLDVFTEGLALVGVTIKIVDIKNPGLVFVKPSKKVCDILDGIIKEHGLQYSYSRLDCMVHEWYSSYDSVLMLNENNINDFYDFVCKKFTGENSEAMEDLIKKNEELKGKVASLEKMLEEYEEMNKTLKRQYDNMHEIHKRDMDERRLRLRRILNMAIDVI